MPEEKKVGEMRRVKVEIFNDTYHLKTDDPESLEKLVQMVDFYMRLVAQNTHTFSGSQIGVMAALKIAEEYMQLKKDYDALLELIKENK